MNAKLQGLIIDLMIANKEGDFFKAIEINEEITKILNTYKESC